MADAIAPGLLPLLVAGLNLRDRVAHGERPLLSVEQANFKVLLNNLDRGSARDAAQSVAIGDSFAGSGRDFLGLRYAVVCWLDEIMIEAGWREWDENKLEQSLYRTNIRYSNFWQQSRLAEADPSATPAQIGFFLCTVLGFRGELAEDQERFREWVSGSRGRAAKILGREPAALPEKTPITDVPPLYGVESYRKMTQRLVGAILLAVPVVAFLLVLLLR
jgi:type VI protein secretion system component VasF